jgi:hypothetical protein
MGGDFLALGGCGGCLHLSSCLLLLFLLLVSGSSFITVVIVSIGVDVGIRNGRLGLGERWCGGRGSRSRVASSSTFGCSLSFLLLLQNQSSLVKRAKTYLLFLLLELLLLLFGQKLDVSGKTTMK